MLQSTWWITRTECLKHFQGPTDYSGPLGGKFYSKWARETSIIIEFRLGEDPGLYSSQQAGCFSDVRVSTSFRYQEVDDILFLPRFCQTLPWQLWHCSNNRESCDTINLSRSRSVLILHLIYLLSNSNITTKCQNLTYALSSLFVSQSLLMTWW